MGDDFTRRESEGKLSCFIFTDLSHSHDIDGDALLGVDLRRLQHDGQHVHRQPLHLR